MKVKIYTLHRDLNEYEWQGIWEEYRWEIGENGDVEYWRKKFIDLLKVDADKEGKQIIRKLKKLPKEDVMLYIEKMWGLDFMESEEER